MKSKSFFNNQYVIGTGSTVLGGVILSVIGDYFKFTNIFGTIWSTLSTSALWVWNFATGEIGIQRYLVVVIFFVPFVLRWLGSVIRKGAPQGVSRPEWMGYRKDNFEGVVYKWHYHTMNNKLFDIVDIRSYCPKDDCQLVRDQSFTPFYCQVCKEQFAPMTETQLNVRIRHSMSKKFGIES